MARIPRSLQIIENYSVHKMWRGHNHEFNLGTNDEKLKYLELLNEDIESEKFQNAAAIQALTLMSNHTHEIFHIDKQKQFSNHMRRHHSRYGDYFNRKHRRCGKVAQDRPKTCLIEDFHHAMTATFYIHANPIRAGMVKDMRNYYFSTHNLYAFGKRQPWMKNIKLPDWYMKLARTREQRQKKYRSLFAKYLKEGGRKKQTFLKKIFFGNIQWVINNEEKISEWRTSHSPP